ncbi:MYB DNA-binding domain-containing protein [Histoplasma capsulatum var. duboisii H88]|nr:MYB DNA-binding domain-containing protein [Histoplasma capsulatum var. duboisii H88]
MTMRDPSALAGVYGGKDAIPSSIQADATSQDTKPLGLRASPRPNSSSGSLPTSQSMGGISLSHRSGSPPVPPSASYRSPGSKTSPRISLTCIPTGPRALQRSNAPRSAPKPSNQWVRPGYASRGPSIMNFPSPIKRDVYEDKDRGSFNVIDVYKSYELEGFSHREDSKLSPLTERIHRLSGQDENNVIGVVVDASSEKQGLSAAIPPIAERVAAPLTFGQSSGEETDEEDDLDEEDFNEGEKRFEKEMQALASEMPPSTLQDPVIVDLLLQIQMLGILAEGVVPTYMDLPDAAIEIERPDQPPAVIPVLAREAQDIEVPPPSSPIAQAHTGPPLEMSSLESLPFLQSGPPTPFSDISAYQETIRSHDLLKEALREELAKQRKRTSLQHQELRREYAKYYKPWRMAVEELDRTSRQEKTTTPGPSTPPSASGTATTPSATTEGRRGYKLNSELDFQNALIASTITAQEEQARRREKEGPAKPDITKEALIPDMFEEQERQAFVFKDTNHAVDPATAFEVFAFHPTPDDFTPEEQKIFTEAFLAHPKKWGKIAEYLPGRDFQACINHYYFTKQEFKYKAKLNRKYVRKRGKRTPATRNPKSNALMSDLGVRPDDEGDEAETPAVTDTGRPRRAAAPTFGEVGPDTENSTPTPSSGKKGNHVKDPADPGAEKAPSRRGGKAGGGRGGKRAKAQQQSSLTTPIAVTPIIEPDGLADTVPELVVTKKKEEQKDIAPDHLTQQGKPTHACEKENVYVFDAVEPEVPAKPVETRPGFLQPTSYWSVPEQREFPDLIRHFGKNFEAISQYMRTKTPTMVKNYFQRRVDSGQTTLEEYAEMAEAKRLSGESPGPLPIPNIPPKRRYEATPSSVSSRPLAPNTEATESVDASLASEPTVTLSTPHPPGTQTRSRLDGNRSQPRFYPLAQATALPGTPLPPANDELRPRAIRPQPPQTQHYQQGPRAGYFSGERKDNLTIIPIPPLSVRSPELQRQNQQPDGNSLQNQGRGSTLNIQNLSHNDLLPQPKETQETLRPPQSLTQPPRFSQTQYLQQSQTNSPTTPVTRTHSGRSSIAIPTSTAASPIQRIPKQEFEPASLLRNDTVEPLKSVLPPPNQFVGMNQLPPTMSPTKEIPRPNSTPAQVFLDSPRQVPAKRSNIMNILNDSEEPPSRKRFVSDQNLEAKTPQPYSISNPIYEQSQSVTREESAYSSRQLPQRSPYPPQQSQNPPRNQLQNAAHRSYSENPSYSVSSMAGSGTISQDWMARLDPRGQLSQATDRGISRLPAQQTSNLGYMSAAQQTTNAGSNVHHQAHQHHRTSYNPQVSQQVQQSQPTGLQGQSQHQSHKNLGKHDSPLTLQSHGFHQPSPQLRHNPISYSRQTSQQQHPPSPLQISAPILPQTQQHPPYPDLLSLPIQPPSPLQISAPTLTQNQQHPPFSQSPLSQPQQRQHHASAGHELGPNPQHNGQGGGSSEHMQPIVPPSSPTHHPTLRQSHQQHHHQRHQHLPQHISSLGPGNQHNTASFSHNGSHLQPGHLTSGNASISPQNSHQSSSLERSYTPPSTLHQPPQGRISFPSSIVADHPNQGPQQQGLHQMRQHHHPNQHQHDPYSKHSGQTYHPAYSRDSR